MQQIIVKNFINPDTGGRFHYMLRAPENPSWTIDYHVTIAAKRNAVR